MPCSKIYNQTVYNRHRPKAVEGEQWAIDKNLLLLDRLRSSFLWVKLGVILHSPSRDDGPKSTGGLAFFPLSRLFSCNEFRIFRVWVELE